MNHEVILIIIIILVGGLAGITNFLTYYYKGLITNKYEVVKYVLAGIGAAILVPLLLNMLSSNLIKKIDNYENVNYFIFAGFCFIAGYFSDRFISSMGEKILKDLEKTKNKVERNEEKIDLLVSNETEIDPEEKKIDLAQFKEQNKFVHDDLKNQMNKIVKSFTGEYKFRTLSGIVKDLNYPPAIVKAILEGLEKEGAVKRLVREDGKTIWGLTNMGHLLAKAN